MKNLQNKTIVCFHIGRGGHFNNSGYLSFIGEKNINDFTYDLYEYYEHEYELKKKLFNHPNLLKKFEQCQENNGEGFDFFEKLGFVFGEKYYFESGGYFTGLLVDNDGTGTIDSDGSYNTTYCELLENCSEKELELILVSSNSGRYLDMEVIDLLISKYDRIDLIDNDSEA